MSLLLISSTWRKALVSNFCALPGAIIPELVNLQNVGGKAKPYQIRRFLRLVERYNIKLEDK